MHHIMNTREIRLKPPDSPMLYDMPKDQLLTATQVADLLGLNLSTITAYKARGQMPDPDQTYGHVALWKESTIRTWRRNAERASRPID